MEKAEKQINEILEKNNLKLNYQISFPTYRIIPDEVRLALSVLAKHGMKITFTLEPAKNPLKK